MKKIFFLAVVEAIAFAVALGFGLGWLMFGIATFMLGEYCYYTVYDSSMSKEYFERQIKNSRKMLVIHTVFCATTLVVAGLFGFLGGYDMTVEEPVGNTFEYNSVHVDGVMWWYLLILLIVRAVGQLLIEKAVKENMELTKRRELYNK